MQVKTSEMTELQIDWAVAKCEGVRVRWSAPHEQLLIEGLSYSVWQPRKNWAQGGPIIDGIDGFELKIWLEATPATRCEAHIHNYEGDWIAFGSTPLIAAMRCYIASKLGDTVDIPEELCQNG